MAPEQVFTFPRDTPIFNSNGPPDAYSLESQGIRQLDADPISGNFEALGHNFCVKICILNRFIVNFFPRSCGRITIHRNVNIQLFYVVAR